MGDIGGRLFGERLGHAGDLVLERIELIAQVGLIAFEAVVFTLQTLKGRQDVVELIEALEDGVAAILLLLGHVLEGCLERSENIVDAAFLDEAALAVGDRQNYAAVDEAALFDSVIDFGIAEAVAGGGDLIGIYAVLYQEFLNGVGARHAELVVITGAADGVRIARDFDVIVAVLAQQIRQAKQAGIAVGKNGRVEFKIDFLPVLLGLCARWIKPLGK